MRTSLFALVILVSSAVSAQTGLKKDITATLEKNIMARAAWALLQEPLTITASQSPRSAGGKHDFFSEGDYWWPDAQDSTGPYIQRDGETNPDNFIAHRQAMIRFSRVVGALASAYLMTGDDRFVSHALLHGKAWFVDTTTRMNPSLNYAQAIQGRATGRGIGIIDTIHLMEVAQGFFRMQGSKANNPLLMTAIKSWFSEYLSWLMTHQYGKDEMNAANNHGTCWVMQVSSFARFTGNKAILALCTERYKSHLLTSQVAEDGSFPQELRRTKPYGYSLFNLDAMAMTCHILSGDEDLWRYETGDGKDFELALDYMVPFVQKKQSWPHAKDVMYWENWPVAHPFLIFSAIAWEDRSLFEIWKHLDHDPQLDEVVRNLPVRNPLIWIND